MGAAAQVLVVLAVALVATVAISGPAAAHGAEGSMTVIAAEPVSATEVKIEVGIVYVNDNDLAEDATVVATLTGPDGVTVGPVDLPRRTGSIYTTVAVPSLGTWTIAVESAAPTATASAEVDVSGQTPATSAPSTTAPPTSDAASAVTNSPVSETSSSSSAPWLLIAAIALVVVGAGAYFVLRARRVEP